MPVVKFKNPTHVAEQRLCIGCGACLYMCSEKKIQIADVENDGLRPLLDEDCKDCDTCLQACPGLKLLAPGKSEHTDKNKKATCKRWGTVLENWEGYAADSEIRFRGASGGLCTALSLFCMDTKIAGGVLHIGSNPEKPWKNKTYRSTTHDEVLSRAGSRYSPASPCDGLGMMESASDPSVFIGKPCDIAALRMAEKLKPNLEKKTALVIGFFCAGTPSTQGTLNLMSQSGIGDPGDISDIRYRGMGWPGMATILFRDAKRTPIKMTYQDSWGFVQKYRPWRCYLCPDLTAEFADISVGDPWYREIGEGDPGRSLILIRTEKGREIFHQALKAGYLKAEVADPDIIYRSQKNLLSKRQAIWGRLMAMKMLGIPTPKLEGFHLFENWMDLPIKEKARSIFGTAKRIIKRNYFKPLSY